MEIPLYIMCDFSLASFNIFFFVFKLLVWLISVLAYISLGFSREMCMYLSRLHGLWWLFPFRVREVLTIIFSNIWSHPFFFSSSSGTAIIQEEFLLIGYNAVFSLKHFYFITNSHRKCFGSDPTYIEVHFLPYSQQGNSREHQDLNDPESS